jgi:hypothetical protein
MRKVNLPRVGFWVMVGLGIFVIMGFLKKSVKTAIRVVSVPSDKKLTETLVKSGTDTHLANNMVNASSDIYDAFYGSSWDENEDKAVSAVNQCKTANDVVLLCKLYREKYGYSLKADFYTYALVDTFLFVNTVVKSNWS